MQFPSKKNQFGEISKTAIFLLSEDLKILYQFAYIKSHLRDCREGRYLPQNVNIGTSNVSRSKNEILLGSLIVSICAISLSLNVFAFIFLSYRLNS